MDMNEFPVGDQCWYLQSTRKYRCRIHGEKIYYFRWQRVHVFEHRRKRVGVFLVENGTVADRKGATRYVAPISLTHRDPPEGAEVRR